MSDYTDQLISGLLIFAGLVISVHYFIMANCMKQAPHFVKMLLLPITTGAGVGMAYCGVYGLYYYGALLGAVSSCSMALINFAAWHSGAYVSEQFNRAAKVRERINRDANLFVRQYDQMTDSIRGLFDEQKDKTEHR